MNWTKKSIEKAIEEARIGIELTSQILTAIREFEHHAKVNKRFTDRMQELDCHAYIQKGLYDTRLSITKGAGWGMPKAEVWIYVTNEKGLAWETIKTQVARHDFDGRLKDAKERLEIIEKETQEAKELLAIVKSKKFKCFNFDKSIWEIEGAVTEALKS